MFRNILKTAIEERKGKDFSEYQKDMVEHMTEKRKRRSVSFLLSEFLMRIPPFPSSDQECIEWEGTMRDGEIGREEKKDGLTFDL